MCTGVCYKRGMTTPAPDPADRPTIRAITRGDFDAWKPLWDGYNAFYGREGPTALAPEITQTR